MNGARLKQLLRSKPARWVIAAGMVVKAVLLAVAVFGAVEHAQAQPLPVKASTSQGLSHVDQASSFHPGWR